VLLHNLCICLEDFIPNLLLLLSNISLAKLLLEQSELELAVMRMFSQSCKTEEGEEKEHDEGCLFSHYKTDRENIEECQGSLYQLVCCAVLFMAGRNSFMVLSEEIRDFKLVS
jgi:hypothetical protein